MKYSVKMASSSKSGADFKRVGDSKFYVDTNRDNLLGQGAVGTVLLGYFGEEKRKIAAKKITVLDEEEFIREYERGGKILKRLRHENIIRMHDSFREKVLIGGEAHVNIWTMLEYCPLGSLAEYCRRTELSMRRKVKIMSECAHGLNYLHNQVQIFHRNIKPKNVLISGTIDHNVAKLSSFGWARYLEYDFDGKTRRRNSLVGTEAYMPPEMFSQKQDDQTPSYKYNIDVFSLGLTYLALLGSAKGSRLRPYQGNKKNHNIGE